MKLMIVDDHAETRAMIRQIVGDLASDVCECTDGTEAVRQCAAFQPDVVTMDLNMHPMTGFETTRQILARHPFAKVIVVTSLDHAGVRDLSVRSGASHFILKDDLSVLRRVLAEATDPTQT